MPKRPDSDFMKFSDWINHKEGDWITIPQAAKKYNYTRQNIWYLVRTKECIVAVKKGRDMLVLKSSLEDYFRRRKEIQ